MIRCAVYADFHNADPKGRIRLNCAGTSEALSTNRITLSVGLPLLISDDELEAEGEAHYSDEEHLWVAVIDWNALRPRTAGPALALDVTRPIAEILCQPQERP